MISAAKAKEIGIARFIMKPVARETLAKTVRQVLDKSQTKTV
jgi:FixJ family two-component response regulator